MIETTLPAWATTIIVIAASISLLYVIKWTVSLWAGRTYQMLLQNPPIVCDIDTFVGAPSRNPVAATKVVLAHQFRLGSRIAGTDPIPLECIESSHVPGLQVTYKAGTAPTTGPHAPVALEQILQDHNSSKSNSKQPIVVATIRMGFGHHRLAYSATSWALEAGYTCIFHDLLNIHSPEADLIKDTDELYSRFSRYASEMGGAVERLWGSLMLSGDADALRVAALTAAHLEPLLTAYPLDIPMITTHQLVALTAAAAGFTNVVNLVVDNHAQWFLTIPNTLNLVQGPVNYQAFLRMGVPASQLQWAGHWCPADMVQHIDEDCQRRIQRRRRLAGTAVPAPTTSTTSAVLLTTHQQPVRILIPVGGAGAQRKFIVAFVHALADHVRDGKIQLLLNAGDHKHMKQAFLQVLAENGLDTMMETITTTEQVLSFQDRLIQEPVDASTSASKPITLFAFEEYFPAVATTDILCRVTDVLACKPSELAFYCVPKLHIRRVGDHEAQSAKRASELGDGTEEAREIVDAMRYIDLFLQPASPLLISMNEAIMQNNKIGLYDGCQKAVQWVVERHEQQCKTMTTTTPRSNIEPHLLD